MYKTITTFLVIALALIFSSASLEKTSTGISGYTGSPGEQLCNACHGGGSSASSGVNITAVPAFTANQYYADSLYQINVQVQATGFTRFGFDCEILDSVNQNAGTMQNPSIGVKFLNHINGRKNATHTSKKVGTNSATFSFKWVAPSSGQVNFYVCGNAVNNDNNTTGDLPVPAPSLQLYPAELPIIITGIKTPSAEMSAVTVFPNPARDLTTVSFWLKSTQEVFIELYGLDGKMIKNLYAGKQNAGANSQIVNLEGIAAGVYFIKINAGKNQSSQKLLTIH